MPFEKLYCAECDRKTWQYKEGNRPFTCTDHQKDKLSQVGEVQGGSLYSRIGKEKPSEREISIANRLDRSLWRFSEERLVTRTEIPDAEDLFGPDEAAVEPRLGMVKCSFCGADTDQVNVLQEKKATMRRTTDIFKQGDEIVMQDRVTSRMETVSACPNCSLKIRRPIVLRRV